MTTEDRIAPDGKIWVCMACGKTSHDLYGDPENKWWDASCVLNSSLVDKDKLVFEDGRVSMLLE